MPKVLKGPWNIFSGRFNGVEEMEVIAHLAPAGRRRGGYGEVGKGERRKGECACWCGKTPLWGVAR